MVGRGMSSKDMYGKLAGLALIAIAGIWFLWSLGHQHPRSALPDAVVKAARPQQEGGIVAAWTPDGYLQTAADAAAVRLYRDGGNTETLTVLLEQPAADSPFPGAGAATASDEALAHAVRMAHRLGMRAALAVQVELTGDPKHWRSDIGASLPPAGRARWLAAYKIEVMHYARLAARTHVEELVVGSELGALSGDIVFWRSLVAAVRRQFHGQLTYAAQLHEAAEIRWWDVLDQIGVDLYPILASTLHPSQATLAAAWTPVAGALERLAARNRKPLLVTEIGYPSAVGAAEAPLAYNPTAKPDLKAQQLLYQTMFAALWDKPWLAGIWLYGWQTPNATTRAGYTPVGKPAEQVVRRYFHAVG